MPCRRLFQNGNENTQGVIAQRGAAGYPRDPFGPRDCHRSPVVVFLANARQGRGCSISALLTATEAALLEFGVKLSSHKA